MTLISEKLDLYNSIAIQNCKNCNSGDNIMLHKTRFNVVNTNSVNYAALEPIMLHAALYNPLCYNQSCYFTIYYATIKQNHTTLHLMLTMVINALLCCICCIIYKDQTQQTQYIYAAQDKQQSIQYHAAMMLYQKLTVCQTLLTQTQKYFISSHKPRTINQT